METNQTSAQQDVNRQLKSIPATFLAIITDPAEFFRQMPKTGGFFPPFIFMVLMGVAAGLLQSLLALTGFDRDILGGLAAVILMPLLVAVFGFVGAAILFVFWKILGSDESFETAYRCGAYIAVIMPINVILGLIPYLGGIAGLVWVTYLLVVASTESHGISAQKAWIGFGVIGAIMALSTLSMEIAGRKMMSDLEDWQKNTQLPIDQLDKLDEMTPEEAGKAVGQFMKAMGQAAAEEE